MGLNNYYRWQTISGVLALAVGFMGGMSSVTAQKVNVCDAPKPGEYLLLINSPTQDNRAQLKRVLPSQLKISTCKYLNGKVVTRLGGFNKIDDANRWARYIRDSAGLNAIITTRPADNKTPKTRSVSYKPRSLGKGYAVLVDYYNRPQMASRVRNVVKGDVGFVSYGQRPYLLATYTTDQKAAYKTLQNLSEKGFFTIIVDSRKVMLLRSVVKLP
ncbi:MAG: hypothetical protein AAF378_05610 [Cyanobacteria bacterium P01_A01_bin.84]